MVNLDGYKEVLSVRKETVRVQAGIRLHDLGLAMQQHGLAMPNLGSIDQQSIAGAISTATHGSTLQHGIMSDSIIGLRLMLANGRTVWCSKEQNLDLFRAALVSLGALGIIVEVDFRGVPSFDISWQQSIVPLEQILARWEKDLWTQAEFVRVWWLPYTKRAIIWKADKTSEPRRKPKASWYGSVLGYHTYHTLLYVAQYIPRILPTVEWFIFGMQYGFKPGPTGSAVQEARTGLLMDCLYSQFVNEWALPLEKGPEAISRLSTWLHGDAKAARIPLSPKGTYVHGPIEVRCTNSTGSDPRPFLDPTSREGPTLYLNATLYRPYGLDPPCRERYYEAFERLMKELGGRPHWAKNFATVTPEDIEDMYGDDLEQWRKVRSMVDPDGVFVGDWHRRNILAGSDVLANEERIVDRERQRGGGVLVWGEQVNEGSEESRPGSAESYEVLQEAEAGSILLEKRN